MEDSKEVQDASDYKLDKHGKKVKAHRIVFNKGEDDGKKGVSEQMKKSFNQFLEQHTPDLTEEQKNELVAELQEVLGKDASAGEWISDFVHSDNPKFAGKSKEKRKQMALAAFYAKQRNEETEIEEELKGNQHKLDKNKNGKVDKHDFKLLRKEEAEQIDEAIDADDYTCTSEKSSMTGGHRPHIVNKSTGKTMHLSQHSYKSPSDAKAHAKAYLTGYAKLGPNGAERAANEFYKSNKDKLVKESVFDWKNKARETSDKSTTATKHDVKKTSTGTVYTKQRDADGMSKEFNRSGEAAQKRGRGRPKKSSFGEAVEFLMGLDEETFDSMMEEGFDAFMEHYEQLDELSKTTLGSYVKNATKSAIASRRIAADFENQADKARKPSMKDASKSLADKWKSRTWKRSQNIDKAVDRLTK